MRRRLLFLASVPALAAALLTPPWASAATIKVTATADEFGDIDSTGCALREAVQTANTNTEFADCVRKGSGGADTIVLQGGVTYTRTRGSIQDADDTNVEADIDVATGRLTIEVRGEGMATIDAGDLGRVIDAQPGAILHASRIVVQNGTVLGNYPIGVGIRVRSGARLTLRSSSIHENNLSTPCGCGGGILTEGNTTLTNVDVTQNRGGGILFADGELAVSRSTITGNSAFYGSGVYLAGGSDGEADSATLTQTTISGNEGAVPYADGGGIYVQASEEDRLRATNVTISGNRVDDSGGGVYQHSGTLQLNAATVTDNTADADENGAGFGGGIAGTVSPVIYRNSIVAGNHDLDDCYDGGPPAHNLVGIGTGCDETGSNVTTTTEPFPDFGLLATNGGPTETHALLVGNSAIGKAGRKSSPSLDQRGVRRDRRPDIGAYER